MANRTVAVDQEPFECVPHWLLMDPALTANALRVYMVLRKHRDYQTGQCWPGRRRLAAMCHLSVKTVDRALDNLQTVGAVTVVPRKKDDGSNASNLYHVHWARWGKSDATLGTETTQGVATETTHEQRPIDNEDPQNEVEQHHPFDEFWLAYPRKDGKINARKAFTKAVGKVGADFLIHAVVEYRQWCERTNLERQFIPHASTWLNGERWDDERPEPHTPDRMQGHRALIQELWENETVDNPQKQLEG